MGFKVPRLWRPPYLQIALDAPSLEGAKKVIEQLPGSDRIIIEVGTPLIKRYGTRIISEARRLGIYAVIDMLNVEDVMGKLKSLKDLPDVIILHRGIDQESGRTCGLERIKLIRQAFPNKKYLIAVAGGIVPETAKEALEQGADILIVGRYVTQSKDVERSVRDFLELTPNMREDVDLYRVHTE
jgi:bifunctional enzyme Fae/Hps